MEDDVGTLIIHADKLTTEQFNLICEFVYDFAELTYDGIGVLYEQEPILIKGNIFELSDIAKDCYRVLHKAQMAKNMTVIKRED